MKPKEEKPKEIQVLTTEEDGGDHPPKPPKT